MSARNNFSRRVKSRLLSVSLVALAGAGCATNPPTPPAISAESAAASFTARSLDDPALRHFLAENIGRDPGETWDFEALSWVAFYYQPSLEVARAQWATTRATRQTVAARPNPTVSITPGYNSNHDVGVSPWFPTINFDFLIQGDKRARQQDIAQADMEVARLGVLAAAWQVRSDVRRALIETQTAAARAESLRAQASAQQQLEGLFQQRLTLGRAAAFEVSAARIAAHKALAAAADAAAQSAAARARLAAALGVPASSLDGKKLSAPAIVALTPEAIATARRESLHSRADVLTALAKIQSVRAAIELEVAKQKPDLHVGPGYQWDQGLDKWSVAFTFELPIFHRNEGPIAEALSRHAEAVAQFTATQAATLAAIDAAVIAKNAADAQTTHAHQLRAEVTAQAARVEERLAQGAADQVERMTSALDLAAAEVAEQEASTAVWLAAGQLEDALQLPFPHLAALADASQPTPTRTP